MRQLNSHVSFLRTFLMAQYHAGRLETHKKTKELHLKFLPIYENYKNHYEMWQEARRRRSICIGILTFNDGEFDDCVADVSGEALAAAGRDRDSVLYRTFFPTGRIEESTSAPVENAVYTLERITAAHSAYPDAVPLVHIERMKTICEEIMQSIEGLNAQEALIGKHRAGMEIARIPLERQYNANANHLRLIFDNNTRLVDSFFLSTRSED